MVFVELVEPMEVLVNILYPKAPAITATMMTAIITIRLMFRFVGWFDIFIIGALRKGHGIFSEIL